jgi:hypothetical protein
MHVGDIDVTIYVCIYILQWNVKKIAILGVFAEFHGKELGKDFLKKQILKGLGKVYFFLKKSAILC